MGLVPALQLKAAVLPGLQLPPAAAAPGLHDAPAAPPVPHDAPVAVVPLVHVEILGLPPALQAPWA